ncbi:putative multispanning membrane protein [Lineolata rhizophorae]|uniref:Transmembrane 9 superfamily member n=1 Tax=Lineolata rhizophorae TaxID=578093 RepID=A0A6A6NT69_9PEZI|nr:putative multispanning membrane protein [Lineolata rhizophorae]
MRLDMMDGRQRERPAAGLLAMVLLRVLLFAEAARAFYIPGWSIKSYSDGEPIPLLVNKVYSDNTQLQYAYSELPFVCPPSGRNFHGSNLLSGSSISLNLGEVLRGDRIMVSDYELIMGSDDEGHYLCSKEVDRASLGKAIEVVRDGYVAEWIVDNLPGATKFVSTDKTRKYYAAGFKMGYTDFSSESGRPRYFINNHFTIVIRYHTAPGKDGQRGKKVIVGFEVYGKSIGASNRNETGLPADVESPQEGMELRITPNKTHDTDDGPRYADSSYVPPEEEQDGGDESDGATLTIPYTYSVYFREEEGLEWGNRWDMYFVNQEDSSKIHWLAIVNSLVICGLLTTVVAVIFARTIRTDIKGYRESGLEDGKVKLRRSKTRSPRKSGEAGSGLLDPLGGGEAGKDIDGDLSSDDESIEDMTGWKLVHGDVFRPPAYGGLLAPLVGSGTQLIFMAVGLLFLSCIGVLNPSYRGGFVSVGVALFIFAGVFSGYFSGRVYKTFGGQRWQKNCLVTATLIPGLLFATIFVLNLFVWAQASSTALPFGTLVALVALWLLIQLPLVYVGSWYGYVYVGAWEHPLKTSAVPRQIPSPQPWYASGLRSILIAGLIPFLVIFVELLFVFKSVWQDKSGYYYVFGFLAVVSTILLVTVVEVAVVSTYAQLGAENYHWWWRSFLTGGASAVWVFAYCVWYYAVKLKVQGFVSGLLFFSYSGLACVVYGLLTGTVGFLASYAFVRRIYSAIKAD